MAVSRDYSIIDIAVKDNFVPAPTTEITSEVSGGNALLGGSISRTSTGFGRTATVKAGEDIRPALESLRSAGGGTLILLAGVHKPTYDIVGGSKINIVGEGIDQTVIDFGGGAYAIQFIGAEGSEFSNFSLRSFSVT
ncbi:MAG TPA: hypothetical protein VFY78_12835, partial [Gammaproteobacteria bacterium]|nr:hypothetical protein [Gammaproteobacteria bacterium]